MPAFDNIYFHIRTGFHGRRAHVIDGRLEWMEFQLLSAWPKIYPSMHIAVYPIIYDLFMIQAY